MMFKNKLIFNKYKVKSLKEITNLCWTFEGVNIKDNEPIFIKIEKKNLFYNFLECEAYCLINLKGFGIPKIISYGKSGIYDILIEELLGTSLYELWEFGNKKEKFNLKNVCMVALQILDRLEYIHSKNYIHRDIKPQNFVNGRKDPNIIYIIDFGFSHQYKSSRTGKHIKYINRKMTIGSLCYLSVNSNIGYEQSRRDDLESLGYMLIFLATGSLPWLRIEHLMINKFAKYNRVYNLKKKLSGEKLCEKLPEEFAKYINYCRKLDFEEDPNYDYLRGLFSSILEKNQEKNDLNFFWNTKRNNFNKEGEERKSESSTNIHKRKNGSKKRLFKKIKNSLEKSENKRKSTQQNNLHLEHVNDINLTPINKITYYLNNKININDDNLKNINKNKQIINKYMRIIDYQNKHKLNFKKIGNKNKNNLNNKNNFNIILKSKTINNNGYNNNKSTDNVKIKNIYNNEMQKNHIKCLHQNNKFYYINKFLSNNKTFLKLKKYETNNSMNNNKYNREYNYYNQSTTIPKKKMNDNILFKRINNYRTLYEREKDKFRYISSVINNSANYFNNASDTINQNKIKNSVSMKMVMDRGISNSRNIIGSISQKQFGKQNINYNFINNSYLRFNKNMNASASTSDIEKIKFKRNNEIKAFQINNLKNYNSNNNIYSKGTLNSYVRFTGENSDSRLKLKEKKIISKIYNKYTSNKVLENLKKNQLYNKYRININPSINNANDILLTDNSSSNTSNINSYSLLNNKIFHKDNRVCLTQRNKDIKFLNIYENNLRKIQKNIASSFIFKDN